MSLDKLKQQYSDSSLFNENKEVILTKIDQLDIYVPITKGSVTEIYGDPGVGKTTTLYQIIANLQKQGKTCVYVNFDGDINFNRASTLGVDMDKLILLGYDKDILKGFESIVGTKMDIAENIDRVYFIDSLAVLQAINDHVFTDLVNLWKKIRASNDILIITNQIRSGYKGSKTPLNKVMRKICTNRIQLAHSKMRSNKSSDILKVTARVVHEDYFYINEEFSYEIKFKKD